MANTAASQQSTSGLAVRNPRDHDGLATIVHQGTFTVASCSAGESTTCKHETLSVDLSDLCTDAIATVILSALQPYAKRKSVTASESGSHLGSLQSSLEALQLYTVAAPSMRHPQDKRWALPVRMQQDWIKTEKGYFDAPGDWLIMSDKLALL